MLRSTESEIVATAKTEADQIGGTVEIYYREDFDSYSSCELCDATYPDATAVHLYGYGFCSDECADDWASEYLEQNDQALASEGLPAASCSLLNDQPTNDE